MNNKTVMFCQACADTNDHVDGNTKGYLEIFSLSTNDICPYCGSDLIDTGITSDDLIMLMHITNNNRQLLDAMVDLHSKDIIEYELKMSQFRNQYEQSQQQQKQESSSNSNQPKCPTCSSTNIQKIGGLERVGSVAMLGLFSKKINKSFKCGNCGHTW